jgi:predicted flap endonuclease-1-like 5' DNA nuclease
LLVLSSLSVLAAVFVAALIAAVAAIVFYRGFAGGSDGPVAAAPVAKPVTEAAPVAAPAPVVEAAPQSEPAPEPESVAVADAGDQPTGLDGPRAGTGDDLKKIKGVGPKLEKQLNSLGYWHFDQIANWSAADVAWMDENLKGFKGRVSRDNWVAQSKTLSGGSETEFSKRVEDGGVY